MTEATPLIDPVSRRLLWDACYNAREIGGYPTADGGEIAWRRLVRTDNLSRLTAIGQAALVDYGVRTIIDLRDPSELAMEPHAFLTPSDQAGAPAYYNLPLIRFDDPGWQAADADAHFDAQLLLWHAGLFQAPGGRHYACRSRNGRR